MPTIKENLIALIAAVEAEPERLLNLGSYETISVSCGTLHCTLGLAAVTPFFQAQGLSLQHSAAGAPISGTRLPVKEGSDLHPGHAAWVSKMFGPEAYARLFEPRGEGAWDHTFGVDEDDEGCPDVSDKQLALLRLRRQLQEVA